IVSVADLLLGFGLLGRSRGRQFLVLPRPLLQLGLELGLRIGIDLRIDFRVNLGIHFWIDLGVYLRIRFGIDLGVNLGIYFWIELGFYFWIGYWIALGFILGIDFRISRGPGPCLGRSTFWKSGHRTEHDRGIRLVHGRPVLLPVVAVGDRSRQRGQRQDQ